MPSIKCISCGHRMLRPNATQTCTNCGAPLIPPELMDEEEPQQSLVLYAPSQVVSPEPALPTQTTEPHMALQPYSSSTPAQQIVPAQPQMMSMSPFDASSASVPAIFTGSTLTEAPVFVPPPWDSESLPRGFPKRPPDISGTLVFVQSQLELRRNTGLGKAFVDAIWPAPSEQSVNKEKQVNVTTLRIRSSNGLQQDARMEGYLKGANVSIGDTISIWGRKYKGALVIYRGYNHTTKSVVMTNTMTSSLPFLFLIIVMLALFFMLASFAHINFFHYLQQFIH
jgi:hypothetical protein